MKNKKYVNIKVTGNNEEINEFLILCGHIQNLGQVGANRTIELTVDGDGSGQLSFYINESEEKMVFNPIQNIDEKIELYIGE